MNREEYEKHEIALLERYLAGDESAGGELMKSCETLIKSTIRRVLRLRPKYRRLFDDLVGEGNLAVWRRIKEMTSIPKSFRNVVITTVRRALLKVFDRREEPHSRACLSLNTAIPDNILARECADLEAIDVHDYFFSKCQTERERQILEHYFQRYTAQETGDALGVDRKTVIRAFKRLRQRLQKAAQTELT